MRLYSNIARWLALVAISALPPSCLAVRRQVMSRVLILTTESSPYLPTDVFQRFKVPNDTLILSPDFRNSTVLLNLELPTTTADLATGRYCLVVVTDGSLSYLQAGSDQWTSSLNPAQWEHLVEYMRTYQVRAVVLNDYPRAGWSGTDPVYARGVPGCCATGVEQEFYFGDELKGSVGVDIDARRYSTVGLYHYPATVRNDSNDVVVPVAYFAPSPPQFPTTTVAAVVVKGADGRETLTFFIAFGDWSDVSRTLSVVWLAWGMRGYLGGEDRAGTVGGDSLFVPVSATVANSTTSAGVGGGARVGYGLMGFMAVVVGLGVWG
ncbi:hypothetical protein BJ742DRAFT_811802 [Cladochytrium replicatum]|nr:hypothetical protein BJ742DRAFT_811802 [Cladochytrium replicatum]